MRTIFTMGFAARENFRPFNPYQTRYLGQGSEPPMSESDRNQLLNDLIAAGDHFQAVSNWVNAHPNLAQALGNDYQTFQNYMSNISPLGSVAASVQQRLASPDPSIWVIPATDYNATQNWITFANAMFGLIGAHSGGGLTTPGAAIPNQVPGLPGVTLTPVRGQVPVGTPAPAAGIPPLAIGIGAAAVVGLLVVALG